MEICPCCGVLSHYRSFRDSSHNGDAGEQRYTAPGRYGRNLPDCDRALRIDGQWCFRMPIRGHASWVR